MTERKVSCVSLPSTLGIIELNCRGIIKGMIMAEDARAVALATGADFEYGLRGPGPAGIMQPSI